MEPRTPVQSLPGDATGLYVISQPGSYYLTGNIVGVPGKNGISITASNVVLDLNGFALIGVPGSGAGIRHVIGGYAALNIVVKNGTVSNWGFTGINADGYNNLVEGVTASDNGGYGIALGGGGTIKNCSAFGNAWSGLYAYYGAVIEGCNSMKNTGAGIWVHSMCLVTNCSSNDNFGDGIAIEGRSNTIRSNNACYNGRNGSDAGIRALGSGNPDGGNRIDENNVANNTVGIAAGIGGNFIVRNTLRMNATQWSIAPGNDVGPIGSAATATSPWANFQY